MRNYLVTRTFKSGDKEGVLFTNHEDALSALNGTEEGSTLAVYFTELYGDDDLEIIEIDL